MASWIEIDKVRKDSKRFKAIAVRLLSDSLYQRSEFAEKFLSDIANYPQPELTTRQAEVLLAIRDEAALHDNIKGLSVAILLDKCFIARDDLSLEDAAFLERLKTSDRTYVTGKEIGRFKGICKQLGQMERYM